MEINEDNHQALLFVEYFGIPIIKWRSAGTCVRLPAAAPEARLANQSTSSANVPNHILFLLKIFCYIINMFICLRKFFWTTIKVVDITFANKCNSTRVVELRPKPSLFSIMYKWTQRPKADAFYKRSVAIPFQIGIYSDWLEFIALRRRSARRRRRGGGTSTLNRTLRCKLANVPTLPNPTAPNLELRTTMEPVPNYIDNNL